MRIALVHDCLWEYGGAERVVEAMHEIWPDAPVYTSFVDKKGLGRHWERFKNWDIRTSWVEHVWIIRKLISPLRFLIPLIWKSFDFKGFDVVISSSGWFISRGVHVKKPTVHISYIHHPPRNLYGYATGSDLEKYWIVRAYAHIINFFLRHYDFEAAQNVDYIIANSKETARRVWKFYRRKATVIYPPVEIGIRNTKEHVTRKTENLSLVTCHLSPKSYYLSVGRLSWAKRVDLIIQACNQLKLPLVVVGTGKEEKELKQIAGPTVEFLGSVSDEELTLLYTNAKALIFSALDEDFGMVPVEAMAAGTPVIGLAQGGVKETVIDARSASSGQGPTGVLFEKADEKNLIHAIKRFKQLSQYHHWSDDCKKWAQRFNKQRFQKSLKRFISHVAAGSG